MPGQMARRVLIMMIFRSNQIALEEIWIWEIKFGFGKLRSVGLGAGKLEGCD